jgi:hypothetical protein
VRGYAAGMLKHTKAIPRRPCSSVGMEDEGQATTRAQHSRHGTCMLPCNCQNPPQHQATCDTAQITDHTEYGRRLSSARGAVRLLRFAFGKRYARINAPLLAHTVHNSLCLEAWAAAAATPLCPPRTSADVVMLLKHTTPNISHCGHTTASAKQSHIQRLAGNNGPHCNHATTTGYRQFCHATPPALLLPKCARARSLR